MRIAQIAGLTLVPVITKAANALAPLGVKRAEIEKLVDEAVKRINRI